MSNLQQRLVAALVARGYGTTDHDGIFKKEPGVSNGTVAVRSSDKGKWEWYYYVSKTGALSSGTSFKRARTVPRVFKTQLLKPEVSE